MGRLSDTRWRAVLSKNIPEHTAPLAGGNARPGAVDGHLHYIAVFLGRGTEFVESSIDRFLVAVLAPCIEACDLIGLDTIRYCENAAIATHRQRRGLRFRPLVNANDNLTAGLDRSEPCCVGFNQAKLHIFDGSNGSAHVLNYGKLSARLFLKRLNLGIDLF